MKILLQLFGPLVPSHLKKSYRSWYILAKGYGHLATCRLWECRDAEGQPIPWYTYPAIDYLRRLDTSNMRVFEYGCGFSTLFWSKKSHSIISVEDDRSWYEKVRTTMPKNVSLHLEQQPDRYINAINDEGIGVGGDFDIIIIDAKHRYETALSALSRLAPDGMIILDNADWYPETADMLSSSGLMRIDLIGFGPINCYTWCTSLFLRPGFRPRVNGHGRLIGGVDCKAEDDHLGGRS